MRSKEMQRQIDNLKKKYIPYPNYHAIDFKKKTMQMIDESKKFPIAEGVAFERGIVCGIPVDYGFKGRNKNTKKVIFYIHGGGMTSGSPVCGRYMLSRLISQTGWSSIGIDYRLAPEYQYPAPLEDCVEIYKWLLNKGYHAKNIVFLGESAGGTILLNLLSYCSSMKLQMPGAACAISPSVDFNFTSNSFQTNADSELVVNCNIMDEVQELFLGDNDVYDPIASPIYSDVKKWPPVYLSVTQDEILFDDSLRMYLKLEEANVPVRLSVSADTYHCFMLYPSPESEEEIEKIGQFFLSRSSGGTSMRQSVCEAVS